LMGPSGSGRSNFIGKLTGNKEDSTAHRLKPHTQEIREVTVNLSDDRHYVFLDTPGFGDTNRSDRDILCMIAEWLEKRYHKEVKLTGIIYFHRITDNRMSESVCENLDMFNRLCGERAAERVRFVTTMWDNVRDAKVAESRVLHLEGNFWKPLIDRGARHEHFENTFESAWRIVRGLTGEGEAPLIQEELMDVDSESNETTADRTLYTQFQQLLHEQQEIIKQLRDEVRALKDLEMLEQLQAGQRRLEAELEQAWNEKDKLTTPF
ncbi:P-loop containing nucleoside triphosphate hydrolase protein, partial [Pisolithus marmoratus]